MKKNSVLLVQIGIRVAVFCVVMILLLGAVVFTGSMTLFLDGKNEMIDRDLRRIKNEVMSAAEPYELLEYMAEHPEADSLVNDDLIERVYEINIEEGSITAGRFYGLSEDERAAYAVVMRDTVASWLDYEQKNFDYDRIYIMNIGEKHRGYIYCIGEGGDRPDDDIIDQWKNIELERHPAIMKILSGSYSDTEYEIIDGIDGKSYYIGYAPISSGGKADHVICVEYDWSRFRNGLAENLAVMAAIGLAIIGFAVIALIRYLRRAAVIPAGKIHDSVHEYLATKDSSKVAEKLGTVTANNELGVLSHDVIQLTSELDEHISKLKVYGEEKKQLTRQVMQALAHTIDAKDKYTNGHSERVAIYSRMIAKHLGLSEEEQEKIYYMGLLHDIGKIGIPESIINKTSKLDDEEFRLIQSHTIMGYEILKEIKSMPDLALGAHWHHELYDGSGYPDGIKGEEIPLLVRIIAVADSYDAMTSNRSYRKYLPQETAREEIEKNAGKQFDPVVAECMLKIIDSDTGYSLHE